MFGFISETDYVIDYSELSEGFDEFEVWGEPVDAPPTNNVTPEVDYIIDYSELNEAIDEDNEEIGIMAVTLH